MCDVITWRHSVKRWSYSLGNDSIEFLDLKNLWNNTKTLLYDFYSLVNTWGTLVPPLGPNRQIFYLGFSKVNALSGHCDCVTLLLMLLYGQSSSYQGWLYKWYVIEHCCESWHLDPRSLRSRLLSPAKASSHQRQTEQLSGVQVPNPSHRKVVVYNK